MDTTPEGAEAEAAPPTPTHAQLLEPITDLQADIVATKARLDELYVTRADLFLAVSEADPTVPIKAMADAAGVTGPAVSQQITKALEARNKRQAAEQAEAEAQGEAAAEHTQASYSGSPASTNGAGQP